MSSKVFQITLQERSFEVEVLGDPNRQEIRVRVNGKIWPVTVEDLAHVAASEPLCTLQPPAAATTHPAASGVLASEDKIQQETIVRAPLPGIISEIYVHSKQAVCCGQDICAIETMKMNNVIQAPRAGFVERIFVCQGQAVEFDKPLLEIRP